MTHEQPFQCAFCKFASQTVRKLQYHIVNFHYNTEPETFHAALCRTVKRETPAKLASRNKKSVRDYERRMAVPTGTQATTHAVERDIPLEELLKRLNGMVAQKG